MKRRTVLAGLAAATFTSLALIAAAGAQELKEVRIGFQKAGLFPAVKARGTLEAAFKDRGIAVKWVEFAFGPPLLEALNTGNIDYGYTGDAPPIFAQAASANLLYVAALPLSGENEGILVPKDSQIKTVADLKGKRIGIPKGSSAHNTTVAALEKAGIALTDVTPVYLGPADAATAFAGGQIDAWTIWDPYLALTQRSGARTVILSKDAHQTSAFFLANRTFTEKHPKIVGELNGIFARESDWASANRSAIIESLHETTKVDKEALAVAIDRTRFGVTPLTEAILSNQQKTADRFYKLGLIPKTITVKDIAWTWTPNS